jgi:hypothetical protein
MKILGQEALQNQNSSLGDSDPIALSEEDMFSCDSRRQVFDAGGIGLKVVFPQAASDDVNPIDTVVPCSLAGGGRNDASGLGELFIDSSPLDDALQFNGVMVDRERGCPSYN